MTTERFDTVFCLSYGSYYILLAALLKEIVSESDKRFIFNPLGHWKGFAYSPSENETTGEF